MTFPNAIVVLGHSGTTGYNSDPASPGIDANQNSWATGDNPAVQSIYCRLLAVNPAVAGHNTNLGVDRSDIDALGAQVDQALALNPMPDLFMIQEVDNDTQCDGTLYGMKITADDLEPDGEHLSIAGHTKQAALEWKIVRFDS